MSTETGDAVDTGIELDGWQAGVAGGLAGGLVMGAMIWMLNPQIISVAIAGLYGLQGGAVGWIAHLIHSAIFGVVFAAAAARAGFADSLGRSAVAGLVYGAVLWIVMAGLVMPVWLDAVGLGRLMSLPNWSLPGSLPPHLVYGVILGAVFPFLQR